jgi:hypothetical protein
LYVVPASEIVIWLIVAVVDTVGFQPTFIPPRPNIAGSSSPVTAFTTRPCSFKRNCPLKIIADNSEHPLLLCSGLSHHTHRSFLGGCVVMVVLIAVTDVCAVIIDAPESTSSLFCDSIIDSNIKVIASIFLARSATPRSLADVAFRLVESDFYSSSLATSFSYTIVFLAT